MKTLSIILTLAVCSILAVAIMYNLFGRKPDVVPETPAESVVAPTPARPDVGPKTEYIPAHAGKE